MRKIHCELSLSLTFGPEISVITNHLREWDQTENALSILVDLIAVLSLRKPHFYVHYPKHSPSSLSCYIPHHVSYYVLRNIQFHCHKWLK